jgi:hypothetical protein
MPVCLLGYRMVSDATTSRQVRGKRGFGGRGCPVAVLPSLARSTTWSYRPLRVALCVSQRWSAGRSAGAGFRFPFPQLWRQGCEGSGPRALRPSTLRALQKQPASSIHWHSRAGPGAGCSISTAHSSAQEICPARASFSCLKRLQRRGALMQRHAAPDSGGRTWKHEGPRWRS